MKNFNINKNSTQYGRSMIEMLGVLAIVGVLSVGGIAGYSKAMEKFKINKTTDQISQIVTNIRTLYAQQTTYSGLNNENAIKMGVVPDELGSGATLTNSFGGNVYIIPSSTTYEIQYGKVFAVQYRGLSKQACISLGTTDWGSSHSSGFVGIDIAQMSGENQMTINLLQNNQCKGSNNGSLITACSNKTANITTPLPVSTVANLCSVCDNAGKDCQITIAYQ